MSEGSLQQRLVSFLRSVIPADPWQLLLLTGSVCFVVASRLSWRPPLATFSLFDAEKSQQYQAIFLRFIVPTTLLVLFAGFAGYFVCFSPGRNPVRRVLLSVMLPALAGLALALSGFISTDRPYVSILDRSLKANRSQIFHLLPWTSSPGFHFAVAGFISVGIFAVLMQLGSARLPLSLPAGQSVNAEDSALSLRVAMLIWVLMGPYLLAATIPTSFMFAILELSSWLTTPVHNSIFERASSAIQPLLYLGLAYAILGRPFERTLKTSVRLFPPRYLLIAASFPTGIALVFPLTSYLSYRASWVAHNFAKTTSPHSVARFTNPDPWLSLLVISALFEEIVFRGVLRAYLMRQYGVFRGIFLTGMVWAAFHFHGDASPRMTDRGMLWQLGIRIAICTAHNFVFSWLTLRSGSVLPSTLAHALYNLFIFGGFGPRLPWKVEIEIVLWGLVALLLFRYWPIHAPEPELEAAPGSAPEPAT